MENTCFGVGLASRNNNARSLLCFVCFGLWITFGFHVPQMWVTALGCGWRLWRVPTIHRDQPIPSNLNRKSTDKSTFCGKGWFHEGQKP